ncbi:MAG TPA: hypothetical protein VJQ09_05335, partial [Candidatus Limnocylindria bacterium]|nr:hypothetical protein [Candidatus Limnocylindria bacterium]
MDELFRVVVQLAHVLSGVMWIGGGFYTLFVQTPALLAVPGPQRGPAMAALAPRQINYLLRLGEITIATGLLNLFASGKIQLLQDIGSSRWAIAILFGAGLAVVLLGIGHGVLKPAVTRLLALGPRAAQGDPAAATEAAAIMARLKRVGYAQIVLGVSIL